MKPNVSLSVRRHTRALPQAVKMVTTLYRREPAL